MTNPLVSIVISTYNRAIFIEKAIASSIKQSYRPIELIVIDDGSTDDTKKIIENYKSDEQFKIIYKYQENLGSNIARNLGLSLATGKYVRFLDSDDLLSPSATLDQVAILERTGKRVCFGSWMDKYQEKGKEATYNPSVPMKDSVSSLLGEQWYPNFSFLIENELVKEANGWDPEYQALQDRDFIVRIAFIENDFACYQGVVGSYFHHKDEDRISRKDKNRWRRFMGKHLTDSVNWLNSNAGWTIDRRKAVALSLFRQAQRYYDIDQEQFRLFIDLMVETCPEFKVPRLHHRLLVKAFGYDKAEGIHKLIRKKLKIK